MPCISYVGYLEAMLIYVQWRDTGSSSISTVVIQAVCSKENEIKYSVHAEVHFFPPWKMYSL